jgi:hypothetical protein
MAVKEIETLLARWRRECARDLTIKTIQSYGAILCTFLFVGSLSLSYSVHWLGWLLLILGGLGCLALALGASSRDKRETLSRQQLQLHARLNALEDVRAVVPLLHALTAAEPLREVILATLTRLLGRMTATEARELLAPHRDRLYTHLNKTMAASRPDFVIAALRLLPALADRPGLIHMARFIVWDAPTRNEQRVREVARECLPQMLERVELGNLSHWIERLPLTTPGGETETYYYNLLLPPLAVIQNLPRLTPGEYLALGENERHRLYYSLLSMELPRLKLDYSLAVLEMVLHSEDIEALPTVQQLQRAHNPQIRAAARACLPVLAARSERARAGKTLLRGSSAPEGIDTLLRPAASGASARAHQLLRVAAEAPRPTEAQQQLLRVTPQRENG